MRNFLLTTAFVAVALALSSSRSRAEWFLGGNPVCTMPGAQSNGRCAPDGSGGAVILWTDERRGPGLVDLYATRILGDGTIAAGWASDGTGVTTSGQARSHAIVGDGAGGLLAFWMDNASNHVYMQHLDGGGAPAPGFPSGGMALPMTVGGPSGWMVFAVADDAGGAYVLWNEFRSTADVAYLTRVDGSGAFAPGWNASGVGQLSSDAFNPFLGFTALALAPDPSGGALTGGIAAVEGEGTRGAFTHSGPNGAGPTRDAMPFPPSALSFGMVADGAGGLFGA